MRFCPTPVLVLPLLLACCAVGPDYQPPPMPAADSLGANPLSRPPPKGMSAAEEQLPADWWRLFGAPPLDRLVDEALARNADLAAAQAALRIAQESVKANQSVFYPNLSGSFDASRQKDATRSVQPTAADNAPLLNLFTPQLSISYVPDLWGGNRRGQESLEAQSRAQQFLTEATHLTLVTNVAVAAIQEASLRAQITAGQRLVELQTESLAILQRQQATGQVAEQDVMAQQQALSLAEQSLVPLLTQLAQQRHALTALLGRLPGDAPTETFVLADLHPPAALPTALPAQLVAQRPDIRVAEANLQAASALIGVAIANRLPNLTLDASWGSTSTRASQIFSPGNGQWEFGATLTQPLFDGFALMHRERAARAAYDQAMAQYRGTVITAFQNVADSLQALQSDAVALAAAQRGEAAASRSYAIAKQQLAAGEIAPLSLISAEQNALQARIALAQAEANRLVDTAALFQALGGGWWNRGPSDNG